VFGFGGGGQFRGAPALRRRLRRCRGVGGRGSAWRRSPLLAGGGGLAPASARTAFWPSAWPGRRSSKLPMCPRWSVGRRVLPLCSVRDPFVSAVCALMCPTWPYWAKRMEARAGRPGLRFPSCAPGAFAAIRVVLRILARARHVRLGIRPAGSPLVMSCCVGEAAVPGVLTPRSPGFLLG